MTRLIKNTTISWIAGTVDVPVDVKSYKVFNVPTDILNWISVDNGGMVGKYQTGMSQPGGRNYDISFSSEFYGSDTADVPTPLGALFRACGLLDTPTSSPPNTVFTYTAVNPHLYGGTPTGDLRPIILKLGIDGVLYHANNCVGNAVFNFVAGQIPTVDFNFLGSATSSHDVLEETPAAAYLAHPAPAPVQNLGLTITPAGSSARSSLVVPRVTYNMGNILNPHADVNGTYGFSDPLIDGWEPSIEMLVEEKSLTTVPADDWFGNKTRLDISFTHDSGGGQGHETSIDFSMELNERPSTIAEGGKLFWRFVGKQSIESGATAFTMQYAGS